MNVHLEVGAPLGAVADALLADPHATDALTGTSKSLAIAAGAQAAFLAGAARRGERLPLLVITSSQSEAERLGTDLEAFFEPWQEGREIAVPTSSVVVLPPWDTLPLERVSPDVETMGRRSAARWRLSQPEHQPMVVVASVRAALQHLGEASVLEPIVVTVGDTIDPEVLIRNLVAAGYRREHRTEARGEFSVRGGILDIYPSTATLPVRLDLFGDEVDQISSFDPTDQRSIAEVETAWLFPCREFQPTESVKRLAETLAPRSGLGKQLLERVTNGELVDGMEGWLPWLVETDELVVDLFDRASQIVLLEPRAIRDHAIELNDEESALVATLLETWNLEEIAADQSSGLLLHASFDRLLAKTSAPVLSLVSVPDGPATSVLATRQLLPVLGDDEKFADQVAELVAQQFSVTVAGSTPAGVRRLGDLLVGQGVQLIEHSIATASKGVEVVLALVARGFIAPDAKVALIAEGDLTGRRLAHKVARARPKNVDGFFDDLAIGSYVVHRQHGVARFSGVTTRTMGGATRDYLILDFKGTDKLYLPVDQIEAITAYSGGTSPSLSKMGGAEWTRSRAKARAAAAEVAAELVELYRNRLTATGYGFGPDTPWQEEMEALFPHHETPDQLRAIAEVKADMEAERPMDRLICADVGFGKTEIAVRAVFKAVQDGRQAAVLVPTTLLASQHFQTFTDRFAGFPIRVEMLSRFLTDAAALEVMAGLADGSVDVVVGTHRLLSPTLQFKKLGLLVVDEEQRFGVSHKESIKQLTNGVDVLTLSASPIPRTLEMALTGIRDLSMVTTPPVERRPILTYVGEYEEAAVREAIRRELLREGQVFFVHNRVADIDEVARKLRKLVPEARIAIAHGQMDEGTLEQVVQEFWERRADVLLCTTIVESGIDMPTVNTLICDRADLLGLGQLHQLRGRVGRGGQRAYAYLFHPADKVLSETAYERLRTIGEHTELGSGFKIAMRDLEIRGAGNLLGADQSGHVAAVGYDLYVQLVAEAVAAAKGEPLKQAVVVKIDVPGSASLPETYVEAADARLEAYRRLAGATTHEEVADVEAEWLDRYGPLPTSAEGLVAVGHLRAELLRLGVDECIVTSARVGGPSKTIAKLLPISLSVSSQVKLRRLAPGSTFKEDLGQLLVVIPKPAESATFLTELLVELAPPQS